MTITHTTRPASIDEIAAEMDRRGAVIERLEREKAEALAYLKAFVFATIDPTDKRADAQVHQSNPTLGWCFTMNDTGIRGQREILGSQVRRAMEIVGFDRLKIDPPGTTVADDHVSAVRRANVAESQCDALAAKLDAGLAVLNRIASKISAQPHDEAFLFLAKMRADVPAGGAR